MHNSESNARIGAGRMRTPDMLAAGAPIALGTDARGANDNHVMQKATRAAALVLDALAEIDLAFATRYLARLHGRVLSL